MVVQNRLFSIPEQRDDKELIEKAKKTVKKKIDKFYDKLAIIKDLVDSHLGKYKKEYVVINQEKELEEYIDRCIETDNEIAIDTETTGLDPIEDKLVGVCLYYPKSKAAYIPVNHIDHITKERVEGQLTEKQIARTLNKLNKVKTKIIMFNACFDLRVLKNQANLRLSCYWDASIAARLMNENEETFKLKKLHEKYCLDGKEDEFSYGEYFGKINFAEIPIEIAYLYGAHDGPVTYELYKFQTKYLNETGRLKQVYFVFRQIEMEVLPAVVEMEDYGVALDKDLQKKISEKWHKISQEKLNFCQEELKKYSSKIKKYKKEHLDSKIQEPLNIASPVQLSELLYDVLQIKPVDKKTPRGTGAAILEKIDLPLCKAILDYRSAEKILKTYVDKFAEVVYPDGRLRTKWNQLGAKTGRFSSGGSSRNFNFQNIPKENGLRNLFVGTVKEKEVEDEDNIFTVSYLEEVEVAKNRYQRVRKLLKGDYLYIEGKSYEIKSIETDGKEYRIRV